MMNRIFVNKIVSAAIICIILVNIMGKCISFADVDENFILPPSDGSVVTEKNAGINALVLKRGNDELAASLMAQYSYEQPTADKYSLDINFSFTKGSTFQVRNWNLVSWHACFSVDNGKLMFFDTEVDEWEQFCKITSDEIHSLKYEIIGENSMNIYFDGTLVKSNVYKPDGKPSAFLCGFICDFLSTA